MSNMCCHIFPRSCLIMCTVCCLFNTFDFFFFFAFKNMTCQVSGCEWVLHTLHTSMQINQQIWNLVSLSLILPFWTSEAGVQLPNSGGWGGGHYIYSQENNCTHKISTWLLVTIGVFQQKMENSHFPASPSYHNLCSVGKRPLFVICRTETRWKGTDGHFAGFAC